MEFRHFIITRFNVNIEPVDFKVRLEPYWLAPRFDLFQKFCFPSVKAQTRQDFTWLALFDEKTPDRYKKLIQVYAQYPNFKPLFCGAYDTVMPQAAQAIAEIAGDADWVLTTRLDNDDALSEDFVQVLQDLLADLEADQVPEGGKAYINLRNGLQYCEGKLYYFEDRTNAFVSLLEKAGDIETVFWVDHPGIYKKAPVLQVNAHPLWLQNVHGSNLYNYIRGDLIEDQGLLQKFHLQE